MAVYYILLPEEWNLLYKGVSQRIGDIAGDVKKNPEAVDTHQGWTTGTGGEDSQALELSVCQSALMSSFQGLFKLGELVLESQVFVVNHMGYFPLLLKTCLNLVQVSILV